jgi:hypothetical protein
MYWKNQETIVFHIVSFVVFILHISSINVFFVVGDIPLSYAFLIVSFNLLMFAGMVHYAKWCWKDAVFGKSFFRIIKIYFVFLISSAAFFIMYLKSSGKI